jgi:hypothetical protein
MVDMTMIKEDESVSTWFVERGCGRVGDKSVVRSGYQRNGQKRREGVYGRTLLGGGTENEYLEVV